MPDDSTPRSRRALLAAAAGGAAALAAQAALPLTAMAADPNDVVLGTANASTATTSIANSTDASNGFAVTSVRAWGIGVSRPPAVEPRGVRGISGDRQMRPRAPIWHIPVLRLVSHIAG